MEARSYPGDQPVEWQLVGRAIGRDDEARLELYPRPSDNYIRHIGSCSYSEEVLRGCEQDRRGCAR